MLFNNVQVVVPSEASLSNGNKIDFSQTSWNRFDGPLISS